MMPARTSPRRTRAIAGWLGLGLGLVALHTIWSVSIPLMASPDEPSHVVRAAAVARGQWSGELGAAPTDGSAPGAATMVQLPSDYSQAIKLPNCFAFNPDQSASCQRPLSPPDGSTTSVETFAGQYPPLYYALVGWPSRFLSTESSIYAMRIVSGFIASALLVWGFARLRSSTLPAAATWATLVAVTPMTLFIGATVNPEALEISSAVAFWAVCLVLVASEGVPSRGTVVQAVVAGALLVNTRTSGPIWAIAIVVIALIAAPKGRARALWAVRSMRWAVAAAVAAGLAATAWVATHGGVVSGNHQFPQYGNPLRVVRAVLSLTNAYTLQMIGDFGWLDAPSPPLTTALWLVAAGALLLVTLAAPLDRRVRAAFMLAALVVVGAPVALQIPTAVDTGIIWQGRYTLPVAVGVPMLAAVGLTFTRGPLHELVRRMARWIVPALAIAHVAAFWWAMRRYSVGLNGRFLTLSPAWSSPLGYLSAVALYALVIAAVAAVAWRSLRPSGTPANSRPTADLVSAPSIGHVAG